MHYGDPIIRKTVPLVLSLVCTLNPVFHVPSTPSKYSHDEDDLAIALNATSAMGLGLGSMDDSQLIQMCKGTIRLNSFFPDLNIMSRSTVARLLGP